MHRSWGAARKATRALAERLRGESDGVGRGVGVGHDESAFGGRRARVWFEWMEEARERILALFEHSVFERVPGLQRLVRRLLGRAPVKEAPRALAPKRPTGPLGAHAPPVDPQDAAYIRRRLHRTHVAEHAGLRDSIAKARGRALADRDRAEPDTDEDVGRRRSTSDGAS